jgi:hypothetical protein
MTIMHSRTVAALLLGTLATLGPAARAQDKPVAAMYAADQKRARTLAQSFVSIDVRPGAADGAPLQVYLSAGDLERAFDTAAFRPDAAIIPTNPGLVLGAASPATQLVLIQRVRRRADVMRDLEAQAAERRKAGELQIGVDSFVAELPRGGNQTAAGAFPRAVCLLPTDYAVGGAVDNRQLFTQDRVRKGIASCLSALDAAGMRSVVMPLMGASSREEQSRDPVYEGQRLLKECRLINSVAGLALGIHDFSATRKNVGEVGIVQWDREITGMFDPGGSRIIRTAYETYAAQITAALRKGLGGEKTTAQDVGGGCAATFSAQ